MGDASRRIPSRAAAPSPLIVLYNWSITPETLTETSLPPVPLTVWQHTVQAYAGTPAPFNFNGLVRHYYLRERPELGELQVETFVVEFGQVSGLVSVGADVELGRERARRDSESDGPDARPARPFP